MVKELLNIIIDSLLKKYKSQDAINQLSQYLLSGDPTYLPDDVRKIDHKLDRYDLMDYISTQLIMEFNGYN